MWHTGETLWVGFLLLSSCFSSAQQVIDTESWEVPFRLYNGFVVVLRGSIGELQDCNLVIDTGTNPTLVDERIVRKLHVTLSNARLAVASGDVRSQRALISRIEMGPIVKQQVFTAVKDLSAVSKDIGVRIDALVGLDVLGNSNLRINYERKVLAFSDTITDSPNTADFERGPPLVVLSMTMNRKLMRVVFDTGSFGLVLFENKVGKDLPGLLEPVGSFHGVGGEMDMRRIEVDDASVGNSRLQARHAFVAKGPRQAPVDGLLGPSGLGAREISLDFKHGQFAWQ